MHSCQVSTKIVAPRFRTVSAGVQGVWTVGRLLLYVSNSMFSFRVVLDSQEMSQVYKSEWRFQSSHIPYLYALLSSVGWAPLSGLMKQNGELLVTNVHALFIFLIFHLRLCIEPQFLPLSSFFRLLWGVMDSLALVILRKTNQPSWSEDALVEIPLSVFLWRQGLM